ncbi:tryptophan--tRNA ligase [Patescibacteria group bacterium]|nr:tryptophan--tRNA ligase [Patescibacteria group bacterium]MBU1877196.1 tryptophan--tRNA ligase [Patescibacteria group bacterium]
MRIFSGIQPTGQLHIGNYLGAIKQWIKLQETNECIFSIVDLHAITVPYNSKVFSEVVLSKAIEYLACGLDPEKSIIFIQSQVKEHTELAWLLNTVCPLGDLRRMTQFKDKSKKFKNNINAGLFNYPVLMAADILIYQTDLVPVGKDQGQHVELARSVAKKFNKTFGNVLTVPKVVFPTMGAKIMSLEDPTKKMSKSTPASCLFLIDEPKTIEKKIMRATTDSGKKIVYDIKKKPGISNLLTIYSLFSGHSIKELEKEFKGKNYSEFKKSLAKTLINGLEPIRRKTKELTNRDVYIKEILNKGAKRAQVLASSTMEKVRGSMGLLKLD